MADICIPVSDDFQRQLEESEIDISTVVKEALVSKLAERHLSKSKALQRAIFEVLAAKSRLTEENALHLADTINKGMFEKLQERFPDAWN